MVESDAIIQDEVSFKTIASGDTFAVLILFVLSQDHLLVIDMWWTEHFILLSVTSLTYSVTIFCVYPYLVITLFGCDHMLHLVGSVQVSHFTSSLLMK